MIKVHCFVSCVCEVIKKHEKADHRPYYFGVWDADFDLLDQHVLSYHSDRMDHTFFQEWYQLLYNIQLEQWYDEEKSKESNVQQLIDLVEKRTPDRYVMVMLDLSMLPERENKFHQKPFPHYVMLGATEQANEWMMHDPDFRWEGRMPKNEILAAVREPSVKGGYYFDAGSIQVPTNETVEAYFHTCMKLHENPMTDAVEKIVEAYSTGKERHQRQNLTKAVKQLPVLSIRKYAYEHAFAYFWKQLDLEEDDFEAWCDEIEVLVNGFTALQYRAMKYAVSGKEEHLALIWEQITLQQNQEFKIKNGLMECFTLWKEHSLLAGGVTG